MSTLGIPSSIYDTVPSIVRFSMATLRHLLDCLRIEVIPAETVPARPEPGVQRCVRDYVHYLGEACGLAPATIQAYMPFASAFLEHSSGAGQVTFSNLRADDVVGFVRHMAPGMGRKRAKLMTTVLRSFLRYVRYRNPAADARLQGNGDGGDGQVAANPFTVTGSS